MSILKTVRGWFPSRRRREEYAKTLTPEELEKTKRHRLDTSITGGMPEGTGISPTGTPMDFTADEKPPRY